MEAFPRFGTDGVRGLAGVDVTPFVGVALGRAAVEVLGATTLVVGRDSRLSGPMLEQAVAAGATAAGANAELLGVVPTPAVAWVCGATNAAGAMISASHNPFADNGIKLFAPGGLKLDDTVEARIQKRFHELLSSPMEAGATAGDVGSLAVSEAATGWSNHVVASVEGRRFDGMHVVVDCANGSASAWAGPILEALGATVTLIAAAPDGVNINAGVGSTHPAMLQQAVREIGADLGLAFDGDADRLIAVDGTGEVVDGDHILAILAKDWSGRGTLIDNTVVVTVMSNLGFRLAMDQAGITVVETGVGDRYVLEALDAGGYSLGGEQSGHVICRQIASTGDGVLSGVQLLDAIVRSGKNLEQLRVEAMTTVPQILKNVRLSQRDPRLLDKLQPQIDEAEQQMGSSGRILVRLSGTEPLLRVMVEHLDDDTASEVCDMLVAAAHEAVKN